MFILLFVCFFLLIMAGLVDLKEEGDGDNAVIRSFAKVYLSGGLGTSREQS